MGQSKSCGTPLTTVDHSDLWLSQQLFAFYPLGNYQRNPGIPQPRNQMFVQGGIKNFGKIKVQNIDIVASIQNFCSIIHGQ